MRRQFIIAQNILINRRGTICGDVCANTAKANMTFRAELLLETLSFNTLVWLLLEEIL